MTTERTLLQPGDYLHASCSDAIYGEILRVYKDEQAGHDGADVVDLRVFDVEDLIDWPEDVYGRAELPPGVYVTLIGVPYEHVDGDQEPGMYRWGKKSETCNNATHGEAGTHVSTGARVVLKTPGDGCYRCTQLFSVARKPDARKPPLDPEGGPAGAH